MQINYHTMIIGNAVELFMKQKGLKASDVAKMICEKYPKTEKGKPRKQATIQNNITNCIKGRSLPFDTITKVLEVLDAKKITIE